MQITLNIPDGNAGDIVDGVCAATGWTAASGQTKAQWIKDTAKRGLLRTSHANISATIDPVTIT